MVITGSSRDHLVRRIEGEYLEMPGLRLTVPQAARLWGIDLDDCQELLEELVQERFLICRYDGRYERRERSAA